MTFTTPGTSRELPVNCIVHFAEDGIRYYDEKGGLLSYGELTDVENLSVQINGQTFTYAEFLEKLNGAGKESSASSGNAAVNTPAQADEPEAEQDQLNDGQTVPSDQINNMTPDNQQTDQQNADNNKKNGQTSGSDGKHTSENTVAGTSGSASGNAGTNTGSASGSTSGSSGSASSSGGKDSGKMEKMRLAPPVDPAAVRQNLDQILQQMRLM